MNSRATGVNNGSSFKGEMTVSPDDKKETREERNGPTKTGSAISLSSIDCSWTDDLRRYSDALELDLERDLNGVFDGDFRGELDQEAIAAAEGLLIEPIISAETDMEAQQQGMPNISGPSVSGPISSSEVDAIYDAGLPVFSPEDVISEFATLSSSEMEKVVSDLHGITTGVGNLRIDASKERAPRPTILSQLDDELSKLPTERKAAYCQAVLKCPGLVSDKRKAAFLEREDGDPALAAVRLALYWELRLETFGPEKCFLPMTLNGAMRGEVENMVRWPIHQLLPVKDTSGRGIWYMDASLRDFDHYTIEQESMALWYMLETAMEDPEMLQNGLVAITNARNVEMKHFRQKGDGRFRPPAANKLNLVASQAMPIHIRANHLCHPNIFVYYVLPVFLHVFGRFGRQRLQLHRGSDAEVLDSLDKFGLSKGLVPTELGGDLVLDMAKLLASRLILETSRPDPRIVVDQKPIAAPKGPAPKRLRIDVDAAAETNPSKNKCKAKGRGITDPRMTWAVQIRLENPKMPLKDVLFKAGFKFEFKNEKGQEVDSENTTLVQRKNNLCRRVRQEKARRELEGISNPMVSNPMEEAQQKNEPNSTTIASHVPSAIVLVGNGLLGAAVNTSVRSLPSSTIDTHAINTLEVDRDQSLPSSTIETHAITTLSVDPDESGSMCSSTSRDSFYDAILALPEQEHHQLPWSIVPDQDP